MFVQILQVLSSWSCIERNRLSAVSFVGFLQNAEKRPVMAGKSSFCPCGMLFMVSKKLRLRGHTCLHRGGQHLHPVAHFVEVVIFLLSLINWVIAADSCFSKSSTLPARLTETCANKQCSCPFLGGSHCTLTPIGSNCFWQARPLSMRLVLLTQSDLDLASGAPYFALRPHHCRVACRRARA